MAAGALLVGWIISSLLRRWVIQGYEKTEGRFDDLIAGVGHRLVMVLVFLAGLHAAFKALTLPGWLDEMLWSVFVLAWTILGSVFISRLINGFMVHYVKRHAEQSDSLLDS